MKSCQEMQEEVIIFTDMKSSSTTCVAKAVSRRNWLISRVRREIYRRVVLLDGMLLVFDAGVAANCMCGFSDFFEAMNPSDEQINAFPDQDALRMCETWPGIKFVRGDARKMYFADKSFDFVFSSAVIEKGDDR